MDHPLFLQQLDQGTIHINRKHLLIDNDHFIVVIHDIPSQELKPIGTIINDYIGRVTRERGLYHIVHS